MKKTTIILSVLALIASSCGQTPKKQTETANETVIEQNEGTNFDSKLHEKFLNYLEEEYEYRWTNTEYYQNTDYTGLGLVNPKDYRFQLILDTLAQQRIEIANIEEQELLIPLFWKPDYGIFYLTVVGMSGNWYEVQANNETTVWIDKSEFDFYTWEEVLKKTSSIDTDILYAEKDIHSQAFNADDVLKIPLILNIDIVYSEQEIHSQKIDEDFFFTVQKVEGDWIYVGVENYATEEIKGYYWTRWKDDNNKLLIMLYFLL